MVSQMHAISELRKFLAYILQIPICMYKNWPWELLGPQMQKVEVTIKYKELIW